jgi:excisionase family DNA binding protein
MTWDPEDRPLNTGELKKWQASLSAEPPETPYAVKERLGSAVRTQPIGKSTLLTTKQVAEQLAIRPSTIYQWAAQGRIPALKIHRVVRFDPAEIDRWLQSFRSMAPIPGPPPVRRRPNIDRIVDRAKRDVLGLAWASQACVKPRKEG